MIWRDDDIGVDTNLDTLRVVDDIFQRYNTRHTVAIMAAGMDGRPDLVQLIRDRGMLVQLHCWTHHDLTANKAARGELKQAAELVADLFGARPTVLYPPWNRSSPVVVRCAAELGMTVSTHKITLAAYIRAGGDVQEQVVNFHHWHVPEALLLEPALQLAAP